MRRNILLADDSITIQKVIELTFMDSDADLVSVGSGDAALAKLASSRPDLVIADIHMPGASGYEVCRVAKATYPDIPVVLLVGTFEPFEPAEAQAVHADAVLKKPFDSQELLETVISLLAAVGPLSQPAAAAPTAAQAATLEPGGVVPEPAEPETSALDDDLELESWEKLEIAEEPSSGLESGREPVWGNFDAIADAPAEPAAFSFDAGEASVRPETGFSTLAFSRSELTIDETGLEEPAAGAEVEAPAFELSLDDTADVEMPEVEAPSPRMPASWLSQAEPPAPTPISPVWNAPELPSTPSWPEPTAVSALGPLDEDRPIIELAPPEAATPAPPSVAAPVPVHPGGTASAAVPVRLSDEDVDRIARRVVELLADQVVREVAWEVVPDLAELAIKDRLRELEAQIEN